MRLNKIKIQELAEYLVKYFTFYDDPLTQLRLQKLLYFIQGWHLAYFNQELFEDEAEAWVKGPAYFEIYQKYKSYGYEFIIAENKDEITKGEIDSYLIKLGLNSEQNELIEAVLKQYGAFATSRLVYITHLHKPWNDARKGLAELESGNRKIKNEDIKSYFKSLLEKK